MRDQSLLHRSVTDQYLILWYFEDWLKKYFFSILQILEVGNIIPCRIPCVCSDGFLQGAVLGPATVRQDSNDKPHLHTLTRQVGTGAKSPPSPRQQVGTFFSVVFYLANGISIRVTRRNQYAQELRISFCNCCKRTPR